MLGLVDGTSLTLVQLSVAYARPSHSCVLRDGDQGLCWSAVMALLAAPVAQLNGPWVRSLR